MTTQIIERYLKVFCPTHRISFTAVGTSAIICEGGPHALAQNFPLDDFWEYCCDCQNFWPSDIVKSQKGHDQCAVCDRASVRRYLCDQCEVMSLDSGEVGKRKAYNIQPNGLLGPACPGCLKTIRGGFNQHRCSEVNIIFTTMRAECPFCEVVLRAETKTGTDTLICSCGAINKSSNVSCKKCDAPLSVAADSQARKKEQGKETVVSPGKTESSKTKRRKVADHTSPSISSASSKEPRETVAQPSQTLPQSGNGSKMLSGDERPADATFSDFSTIIEERPAARKIVTPQNIVFASIALLGIVLITVWLTRPLPELKQMPLPSGMVYIPGAEFAMGTDKGDEYERPQHKVQVAPFFIDLYEVTCAQYEKFVTATGHLAPQGWKNGHYPEGAAKLPVTGVNWDDATSYAQWVGKRLPTEEEWELAARGVDGRRYPWGNDWKLNAANADAGPSGHLLDVGSFTSGKSPFGIYDMIGNAWEWTKSSLRPYPGGKLPIAESADDKIIRGGFFGSRAAKATTTFRRGWPARGGEDYKNTGFRCAMDGPVAPTSR